MERQWRIWLITFIFNLCDTTGRLTPNLYKIKPDTYTFVIFLRFIFVFLFALERIVQKSGLIGVLYNNYRKLLLGSL
jgi:hypothetical protein